MGMSASQARLLSLQARQSNLEYQGQQINQERSILSQQCTALYNSLLSMTVPTPPSTTDYTTIQYSGTHGSSKFTLGTITPTADGKYNVEMQYARNGLAVKGGTFETLKTYNEPQYYAASKVIQNTQTVAYFPMGDEVQSTELKSDENPNGYDDNTQIMHTVDSAQEGVNTYYYMGEKGFEVATSFEEAKDKTTGGVFIKTTIGDIKANNPDYNWNQSAKENDDEKKFVEEDYLFGDEVKYTVGGMTADEFKNQEYYYENGERVLLSHCNTVTGPNGEISYVLPEKVLEKRNGGTEQIVNKNYDPDEAKKGATVNGNIVQGFTSEVLGDSYPSAIKAIVNSYPEYKNDKGEPDIGRIQDEFGVVFKTNNAGDRVPYFIKQSEFRTKSNMSNVNGQAQIEVFSLESNGSYKESIPAEGAELTFDATGRITKIRIPAKDSQGNIIEGSYDQIDLEASTVTDEAAYKDAYAKYEYETYLYDKKNKEINAKTEIIQQEDRNLELKLQRLDNERTQITTEIEAVEKVINDNIEASYKTFSG